MGWRRARLSAAWAWWLRTGEVRWDRLRTLLHRSDPLGRP